MHHWNGVHSNVHSASVRINRHTHWWGEYGSIVIGSNKFKYQAVSHRSYDIDWWRCWLNWCTQVNVISINNKYIQYYWPEDIYYCYWSKTYIIPSLRSQHTVRKFPKISHVPYSSIVNRTLISKALSRKKIFHSMTVWKFVAPHIPAKSRAISTMNFVGILLEMLLHTAGQARSRMKHLL